MGNEFREHLDQTDLLTQLALVGWGARRKQHAVEGIPAAAAQQNAKRRSFVSP